MRSMLAAALLISLSVSGAEAGVRNFFSPLIQGSRVDACLSGGICGKPAADAFCKIQGYDRATLFQRESYSATRILDSGQSCAGGACVAFRQVKCFSAKSDVAVLQATPGS